MVEWYGPIRVSEWLRALHLDPDARPPEQSGAYLITVRQWRKTPGCASHPLWVGGQRNRFLRLRLGDLVADSFGLYIDTESSRHIGGRKLFKWCREHRTPFLDLWIAWCTADCHRCLEGDLYDHLKPCGTLLNQNQPGRCSSHTPRLTFFSK